MDKPKEHDTRQRTTSSELSGEFDLIVNEINDFIAILEERGQQFQNKEAEARLQSKSKEFEDRTASKSKEAELRTQKPEREDNALEAVDISEDSEDSELSISPRNTVIHIEDTDLFLTEQESSEPIYESFDDVKENDYEAIKGPPLKVKAVATANLIPQKPALKPKPKNLHKTMEPNQHTRRVKALHNFKGTNNDELCFMKGDIITVTQTMEGGWWEGTLNGKTGWFPSNYIKEIRADIVSTEIPGGKRSSGAVKGSDVQAYKRESMQYYHNVVLQNVIDTEKTHVQELTTVLQTYIQPIHSSSILSSAEYTQLVGNLEEIVTFQNSFLSSLEDCMKQPPYQRRVGGIFMKHAPRLKELYMAYSANHPRAAAILQNKRDDLNKFMDSLGVSKGAMTLTTNLYKPFTRLDKYPSLLKELERHVEESHVDRGDTQRAIAVYRDIANACMEIRKTKEMEYEILTSAIKGWEGEEIAKLGEVIHLSQVQVQTLAGDKFDRIFVLFPSVLVMLSMSPRLSGYQYEGQLPLSGMNVCLCEGEEGEQDNSFEISGNMIEKITVTCGTRTEAVAWIDSLSQQVNVTQISGTTKPQSLQIFTSQPSISLLTQAKTAMMTHSTWTMSCLRPSPPLRQQLVSKEDLVRSPRMGRKPVRRKPVRTHSQDEYDYKCRWRQYDPRTMEEDAVILKVIEAYCSARRRNDVNSLDLKKLKVNEDGTIEGYGDMIISPESEEYHILHGNPGMIGGFCCSFPLAKAIAKEKFTLVRPLPNPNLGTISETPRRDVAVQALPKETVNVVKPLQAENSNGQTLKRDVGIQAYVTNPHVLIADEEKIIFDDGDPSNLQEKTLVDTVYSLKDQVRALERVQEKMKRDLEDEQKARKKLEINVKKALKLSWDENLT
ncbi:hypothetical protein FSP39_020103 [Pinctada imbricata]|uniref:Rho guanine nucleotide exchange factor 7 n=1 Tax=Pinctada imbricata TaxID=66713 RepID=A0AA88Y1M3_PINIB|nr:hypothetical protein FSP39_020103 [Pinctada imbricata]